MHQALHSFDVQTAVDNCDENFQEIYFTDFLMKICNHIQIDVSKPVTDPEGSTQPKLLKLGMISHKISLITIFGHKHFSRKNFNSL